MKGYFGRLRDRRHLRKLNKEKQQLIGPTPRWSDTEARVRWFNEALHRAMKNGDHAEVERLTPLCLAARVDFKALLAFKDAENKRVNDRARAGLLTGVR
jgi:hypothetical protein